MVGYVRQSVAEIQEEVHPEFWVYPPAEVGIVNRLKYTPRKAENNE